jgi:NTE family protein
LPGLFTPVYRDRRLLVEGGLVNPVQVSLARAMGTDIVIADDLNTDILGRHLRQEAPAKDEGIERSEWMRRLQENLGSLLPELAANRPRLPSMLDVLTSSINIMQVRITRSRMAGEPPELVVEPQLAQLGLLDFRQAREGIDAGQGAAEASLPFLGELGLGK